MLMTFAIEPLVTLEFLNIKGSFLKKRVLWLS